MSGQNFNKRSSSGMAADRNAAASPPYGPGYVSSGSSARNPAPSWLETTAADHETRAPLREVITLPTLRAVSPVQARFWRGYSLEGNGLCAIERS
jgi:hypothetical protein